MQPTKRSQGRPRKKRRTKATKEISDAGAPGAGVDVNVSDAGMDPVGVDVDCFDANIDLFDIGTPPADANVDQGGVSEPDLEERWDSDVGLKPMQLVLELLKCVVHILSLVRKDYIW
jgi:hypothetical protein